MSEFVVHSIPGSPFGRAVLILLEEKGAPYRFEPVAPGGLKAQPHLSRHPFGRIPVLEHGDLTLYETQAILRYLDRIVPEPALTPTDPRRAALMDQAMNVNDWYLFQGVGNVIGFQRVVAPMLMGLAPDEDAIAAAMPKARQVFDELGRLLGENAYAAGETVSLADVLLAPQLDLMAATPEWAELTAGKNGLRAWLDRMNARASLRATTLEKVQAMASAPA